MDGLAMALNVRGSSVLIINKSAFWLPTKEIMEKHIISESYQLYQLAQAPSL